MRAGPGRRATAGALGSDDLPFVEREPDPGVDMRRVAAVAALVFGLLAFGGATASAEAPLRINGDITDPAGALGSDTSRVQAALDKLSSETQMRLYVVYVKSFSGREGQDWADRSAQASQLGRRDALLAVAVDDRAYGISLDNQFPLSDTVVAAIETQDVRPRLTANDWAGAAIALADGLRTGKAAGGSGGDGSGGALPVGLVVGGVAVVGGGAYVLARRRRRAPAKADTEAAPAPPPLPDPAPGETTDDLAYHASSALIDLDDAVQTSEHELGLARTQFGDEAVKDFQSALEQSRAELVQAFALRQRIDDEQPDEPTRRGLLSQILHLCGTADQRLDAQSAAFDRLRDLEQNLPQVLAGLKPKLNATAGRVPGTTASLDALRTRYAESALEPVADNIPQATTRLDLARTEIDEAGTELAADKRAEAAVSARAAEEAIEQAGTLLDGVRRLADELAQAGNRLVEARAEIEADLAEARLLPGAELAAAAARAEAALTSANQEVGQGGGDPLAALRRLDEAGTALDKALADAQEAREAGERAAAQLDRTLLAARSGIAAASDFICDAPRRRRQRRPHPARGGAAAPGHGRRAGPLGPGGRAARGAAGRRHGPGGAAAGARRRAALVATTPGRDERDRPGQPGARRDPARWPQRGVRRAGSRGRPQPGRRVRRGLLTRQLRRLGHPRPARRRGPLLTARPGSTVRGWTACARC